MNKEIFVLEKKLDNFYEIFLCDFCSESDYSRVISAFEPYLKPREHHGFNRFTVWRISVSSFNLTIAEWMVDLYDGYDYR